MLPALLPPVTMADAEPVLAPIPQVGEHTEMILRELGYETADITQLRDEQII
jgi:crotonobetainyl-CoA:carnitine CoA-transferase CaiB-like acyl-CoA transferase